MSIIENLRMAWRWVDWQGVSAIATLLVALVALWPIWKQHRDRKHQAANFRLRVAPKLLLLHSSLEAVGELGPYVFGGGTVLAATQFRRAVDELHAMMPQASVLEEDEHDKFGAAIANLVLGAPSYGSTFFTADTAKTTLELIDSTIKLFKKHGILKGKS